MSGIKRVRRVLLLSQQRQTFTPMQEVREGQGEGLPQTQPGCGSAQDERVVLGQPGAEKQVQPGLESRENDSNQQQLTTTALDNIHIDKTRNNRTRNDKRQQTTASDSRNVTIRRTASSVRIREWLSNGQLLSVYFKRRRQRGLQIDYIWTIGVHIGYSRKEANRWYHMPYRQRMKRIVQTGDCGLEGLRKALNYLLAHCENMGQYEELQIYCDDTKRFNAYKFLKRYNGFTEYNQDGEQWILYRHPQHWVWNESEGQA